MLLRELPAQLKAYITVLVGKKECDYGVKFGVDTLGVVKYQNPDLDVSAWEVLNVGKKLNERVIVTLAIDQKGFEALHAQNYIIRMEAREIRVGVSRSGALLFDES